MGEGLSSLVAILGGTLGVSLLLAWWIRARSARAGAPSAAPWTALANRLGLEVERSGGGLWTNTSWLARSGSLRVGLGRNVAKNGIHTQIVVDGFSPHPPGLTVEPQGPTRQLASRLAGREIEIGAPDFDAAFAISGDVVHAQAVLDAGTRAKLSTLLRGTHLSAGRSSVSTQATLRVGELRLLVEQPMDIKLEAAISEIEGVIRHALTLARRLQTPVDVAARLAGHLGVDRRRVEPHEGMRAKSLSLLVREFPHHPVTLKALAVARQDPSPLVRLEGALGEGEAGREGLMALLQEPSTPEAVAVRAVEALAEVVPFATLKSLLDRALEQGQHQLARAARQVLTTIQARLHGSEGGGQLSLAGNEGGALALVEEDGAGWLSLEEEAGGALSPESEASRA